MVVTESRTTVAGVVQKATGRFAELEKKKKKKKKKTIDLDAPKKDVIRLGEPPKTETILDKTKDIPVVGTALKVLASPKTTVVLAGVLAAVSGAAVLTGAIGKTAIGGLSKTSGSLIGKHINVDAVGKTMGLTAKQTAALAKEIGRRRISQVANTLTNPKSASLMQKTMSKVFSGKTLAFFGTAAGSIGLGKWAQKETPEPITYIMKDMYRQSQASGDWTLYNEAKEARLELTDMSKWEKILSWTPFISPFITIPKAIKGIMQGGAMMDEVARQEQISQETGESEEEKWARIDAERKASKEAERIEDAAYYKQITKDAAKAKADARKEDEKYWNNVLKERDAYETTKRAAEEKYWEDVRKMNEEIRKEETKSYEDYGKSNLDFGLL